MSIDTEQDSAAMKYIEEVFNTLYVTQEGLRSFNIDQQEKIQSTNNAVSGADSTSVSSYANLFVNNKHRWLLPLLDGINAPTTVAYCLLFLSCNTTTSNDDTCKTLLDPSISPLPSYLINALEDSIAVKNGKGILDGSFQEACDYDVVGKGDNRNLVFYLLTLLSVTMNCSMEKIVNIFYGDPNSNSMKVMEQLISDDVVSMIEKEIGVTGLDKELLIDCFSQISSRLKIKKNTDKSEIARNVSITNLPASLEQNKLMEALSLMNGSVDARPLEFLTMPLKQRSMYLEVEKESYCKKVSNETLFQSIDFGQATPEENDFYKQHFATCLNIPLDDPSDEIVTFDMQPLYIIQQLRNKLISLASSSSTAFSDEVMSSIQKLNVMQNIYFVSNILPDVLGNYFLNLFNFFLSILFKKEETVQYNLKQLELNPDSITTLQDKLTSNGNLTVNDLTPDAKRALAMSRKMMYGAITTASLTEEETKVPENLGIITKAKDLAVDIIAEQKLDMSNILPHDTKLDKDNLLESIKGLDSVAQNESLKTALTSLSTKISSQGKIETLEIITDLCSQLPSFLQTIEIGNFSLDGLCASVNEIAQPIPETTSFNADGFPAKDIPGIQTSLTYGSITNKINDAIQLIEKVSDFAKALDALSSHTDPSDAVIQTFVSTEIQSLPPVSADNSVAYSDFASNIESILSDDQPVPAFGYDENILFGLHSVIFPVMKMKLQELAKIVSPETTYEKIRTEHSDTCRLVDSLVRDVLMAFSMLNYYVNMPESTILIGSIQSVMPQSGGLQPGEDGYVKEQVKNLSEKGVMSAKQPVKPASTTEEPVQAASTEEPGETVSTVNKDPEPPSKRYGVNIKPVGDEASGALEATTGNPRGVGFDNAPASPSELSGTPPTIGPAGNTVETGNLQSRMIAQNQAADDSNVDFRSQAQRKQDENQPSELPPATSSSPDSNPQLPRPSSPPSRPRGRVVKSALTGQDVYPTESTAATDMQPSASPPVSPPASPTSEPPVDTSEVAPEVAPEAAAENVVPPGTSEGALEAEPQATPESVPPAAPEAATENVVPSAASEGAPEDVDLTASPPAAPENVDLTASPPAAPENVDLTAAPAATSPEATPPDSPRVTVISPIPIVTANQNAFMKRTLGALMKEMQLAMGEISYSVQQLCNNANTKYDDYEDKLSETDASIYSAYASNEGKPSEEVLDKLGDLFSNIREYSSKNVMTDNFYIKQLVMLRETESDLRKVIDLQTKVAGEDVPLIMRNMPGKEDPVAKISGSDASDVLSDVNMSQLLVITGGMNQLFKDSDGNHVDEADQDTIKEIIKKGMNDQFQKYDNLPKIEDFFRNVSTLRSIFMFRDESMNIMSQTYKQFLDQCLNNLEQILLENYTNFDLSTMADNKIILSNEDAWGAFKGPKGGDNENFFINQRDMAILSYMSNIVSVASDIDDNIKAMKGKKDAKLEKEVFLYQDRKLLVDVKLLNDSGNIDYMGGLFLSLLQLSNAYTRSDSNISKINFDVFYEHLINAIRATAYLSGHTTTLAIDNEGNEKSIFMQKLKKEISPSKILQTLEDTLFEDEEIQKAPSEGDDKKPPAEGDDKKPPAVSLKSLMGKYADIIITDEADTAAVSDVIARFPSLNNDGKMVDFLMGYSDNEGVFVLPTKELTSEQAELPSRNRATAAPPPDASPDPAPKTSRFGSLFKRRK